MDTIRTSGGSLGNVAAAVALGQVDAAHRRLRTRIARSLGITVADLTALIAISENDEITPKSLAAELGLTCSAVTTTVDRLSGDGQVIRQPRPADRRSFLIRLTPRGTATIEVVWQTHLHAVALAAETSPRLVDEPMLIALHGAAAAMDSVEVASTAISRASSGAA